MTTSAPVTRLLANLENVKPSGGGHTARCPGHDDRLNSLKVDTGKDGQALVYCHAGCDPERVVAALGLTMIDLYPPRTENASQNGHGRRIAATYNYADANGSLLYQAVRFEPKGFAQRRPGGTGGWVWNLDGVRRVLYRLPELLAGDPANWVLVPEGEKDVDRLIEEGFVATTNAGGAGKWRSEYSEALRGRRVCILPDNDEVGEKHADIVARALHELAAEVQVLRLPDLPPKGDVSDWLDAGGTSDNLARLIVEAPPFLSAAASSSRAAECKMRFHSASEIAVITSAEPVFVAEPWAAEGALLEIDGKIKSAGKTTFCTYMCRSILDGRDFMGRPTRRSPIVYLSEQSPATFREALRRADLLDRDDFRVLFWHDAIGTPWPAVIQAARTEASRIGARVLAVDTLGQFAGVKGDAENNAGAALEAVAPLQEAAAVDGLAVIILRHERKGGGDVGDSGRGSSAFAGAVDVVLRVRRSEGGARPGIRVLDALSRFDQTPDTLVIELTDAGYVALGDTGAVAAEEARVAVLAAAPQTEEEALREAELVLAADVKRTVGQAAIREHLEAGRLCRAGEGKRGDPFRYWRPGDGETASAASREEAAAESNSAPDPDGEKVSAATQRVPAESNGYHTEAEGFLSAAPKEGVPADSFRRSDDNSEAEWDTWPEEPLGTAAVECKEVLL
jgi:hypothetical protein